MDKYGKIRMTTVKLKNELIITLKNISNIMDFILKLFCDIHVKLIYSWSYAVKKGLNSFAPNGRC